MRTSVLINNYNNAPFLRECLDSALSQTPVPDEVIVYDDGSDDGSLAILRDYAARGRITLIEGARTTYPLEREHQAHAVAEAFRRSTGKLVFILDADDVFLPGKIECYAKACATNPGAVVVQSPVFLINEHGARLGLRANALPPRADYRAATYARNDVDFYQPTSALAFDRDFLAEVLPRAVDFSDGINLAIDTRIVILAPLFGKVASLGEPLTLWRRHMQSHSVQNKTRMFDETLKRARYFNAVCRARGFPQIAPWRNPRLYRQFARRVLPAFAGDTLARLRFQKT